VAGNSERRESRSAEAVRRGGIITKEATVPLAHVYQVLHRTMASVSSSTRWPRTRLLSVSQVKPIGGYDRTSPLRMGHVYTYTCFAVGGSRIVEVG
jgi:hypothetical protein